MTQHLFYFFSTLNIITLFILLYVHPSPTPHVLTTNISVHTNGQHSRQYLTNYKAAKTAFIDTIEPYETYGQNVIKRNDAYDNCASVFAVRRLFIFGNVYYKRPFTRHDRLVCPLP